MLTARDIGGMMAMMPAFATDAAADICATGDTQRERVERWQTLCAKYAPPYQVAPKRAASA